MSALWLPGQGMVSLEGTAVDRAVKEYDERLFLARNADTGFYTVFRKADHRSEDPFPILAFPELPAPQVVVERLQRMDSQRRGYDILDEVHAANERIRRDKAREADDAQGILAEGMESFLHSQGLTPYHRSLRPTKKTAVKGN